MGYQERRRAQAYNIVKRGRVWGNLLEEPESGVLLANPFRYRGYYYDSSIGLYYLNSRYYDPETGRSLNEDLISYLEPETIGGINLRGLHIVDDLVENSFGFVISVRWW